MLKKLYAVFGKIVDKPWYAFLIVCVTDPASFSDVLTQYKGKKSGTIAWLCNVKFNWHSNVVSFLFDFPVNRFNCPAPRPVIPCLCGYWKRSKACLIITWSSGWYELYRPIKIYTGHQVSFKGTFIIQISFCQNKDIIINTIYRVILSTAVVGELDT